MPKHEIVQETQIFCQKPTEIKQAIPQKSKAGIFMFRTDIIFMSKYKL